MSVEYWRLQALEKIEQIIRKKTKEKKKTKKPTLKKEFSKSKNQVSFFSKDIHLNSDRY